MTDINLPERLYKPRRSRALPKVFSKEEVSRRNLIQVRSPIDDLDVR